MKRLLLKPYSTSKNHYDKCLFCKSTINHRTHYRKGNYSFFVFNITKRKEMLAPMKTGINLLSEKKLLSNGNQPTRLFYEFLNIDN